MSVNNLRDMYLSLVRSFTQRFPFDTPFTDVGVVWGHGRWFGYYWSQMHRGVAWPKWQQLCRHWPLQHVEAAYRDYWVGLTFCFQGRPATMVYGLESAGFCRRLGALLAEQMLVAAEHERAIDGSGGKYAPAGEGPDLLDVLAGGDGGSGFFLPSLNDPTFWEQVIGISPPQKVFVAPPQPSMSSYLPFSGEPTSPVAQDSPLTGNSPSISPPPFP